VLAPLVGGAGMAVVVVLQVANLKASAGAAAGTVFFDLLPWIVVGLFALGAGSALYMRARRPDRYAIIGRMIYEEAAERPELDVDDEGHGRDAPALVEA